LLTGREMELTPTILDPRVGDRYLLCTAGLSGPVRSDAILGALLIPDVGDCTWRLIELALAAGCRDNITVVVADIVLQAT
jgi:serine/threonine protein phosphatase PrpC